MNFDVRDSEEFKFCEANPEIYQLAMSLQQKLARKGIAWHNIVSNECCNDFGCCTNIGEYHTRYPAAKGEFRLDINGRNFFLPKEVADLLIKTSKERDYYRDRTGESTLN